VNDRIETIGIKDPRYPLLLKQSHRPPEVLYVRGTLPPADALCLAVVGSRKPTVYGQRAVQKLVPPIAQHGVVIVSGLAFGIDAEAHLATLEAGGVTVAVLGSGVDKKSVSPAGQQWLAERIVDSGGAIISQFPPGTESRDFHYPIRNRVIAGIAKGTLVVECAVKSGTRITSAAATEFNREVFAVPGSIFSSLSEGPHELIRMGATVVHHPSDILEALGVTEPMSLVEHEPADETEAALLKILTHEPQHINDLIRGSGLSAAVVNGALTLMELKGFVRHVGGLLYVKV
jgi:DNA processing protein